MGDVEGNLGAPVAILQWPRDAARREELAGLGLPRLLVVAPGVGLPELADDEDWVRHGADERDVAARIAALRHRAGAVRLDDTTLRTPRGRVTLSPSEAAIAAVLLTAGTLVPRSGLEAALPGPITARAVDDIVYRLRHHVRPVGLDVFATRGRGFILGPRLDWPVDESTELA